jgi:hypothetical protein
MRIVMSKEGKKERCQCTDMEESANIGIHTFSPFHMPVADVISMRHCQITVRTNTGICHLTDLMLVRNFRFCD